jgi:hypothetical protein
MDKRTAWVGLPGLLAGLLAAGCSDSLGPERALLRGPASPGRPALDVVGDTVNGTFGESGTVLVKGFNHTNPKVGDAIVATFFWVGTNPAPAVTDRLTTVNQTPVGNTYNLVDYVTAGGISMATYVATNVQGFPSAYSNPTQDSILAVQATFASPVSDGGVLLTAYSGVYPTFAEALGAHSKASGAGASSAAADPGVIPVSAGALAYGVTLSNALVGHTEPTGFTTIMWMSDNSLSGDGEYQLQASAGSVEPQWVWGFTAPSTWLASVLSLNEAPTKLIFTVQPSTSLPCPATIPPVQVTAKDDKGNTVTAFDGPVTVAIGHNGGAVMPGTLSGTLTVSAVSGVAQFGNLCIDQPSLPSNGYTLNATTPVMSLSVLSASFGIGVTN